MIDVMCEYERTLIFTASGLVYMCGNDIIQEQKHFLIPTIHHHFNGRMSVKSLCVYDNYRTFDSFSAALVTVSGKLHTWGRGVHGKSFGHGENEIMKRGAPTLVEALNGVVCTQVDLGEDHAAVLTEEGKVYTVGRGWYGQLGHGEEEEIAHVPALVKALETVDIKQVQCGDTFTMALSTSGYVYAWGELCRGYICDWGKLRPRDHTESTTTGVTVPRLVEGLREHNVAHISCKKVHCAALVDPSVSGIRQAQQLHFNNKKHSDVTFMIGEDSEPIYASIDVLSSKSEYFKAMFRSNMRESNERVVNVPGDTSRGAFLKMLRYLCLDDFVLKEDDNEKEITDEVLELADMYLLEGLQLLMSSADG